MNTMKVLSIDVGIKNLAYCLFDCNTLTKMYEIVQWDVINLCGQEPNCSIANCKKKAKYVNVNDKTNYCLVHAKKTAYILPTADLSLKKIKKMSKDKLVALVQKHSIPLKPTDVKKEDILKTVLEFFDKKLLQSVATSSANDLNLIQIGIAMRTAFDKEFVHHLTTIEQIVIENQISPIANRMKSLQGMIAQYFIMNDITNIEFVSAANKLKGVGDTPQGRPPQGRPPQGTEAEGQAAKTADTSASCGGLACFAGGVSPTSYASRKKEGIRITLDLLKENEKHSKWLTHFNAHKKKDDLADAFLQGNWFLKKK